MEKQWVFSFFARTIFGLSALGLSNSASGTQQLIDASCDRRPLLKFEKTLKTIKGFVEENIRSGIIQAIQTHCDEILGNVHSGGPPGSPAAANVHSGGPPGSPTVANVHSGGPPGRPAIANVHSGGPPGSPTIANVHSGGPPGSRAGRSIASSSEDPMLCKIELVPDVDSQLVYNISRGGVMMTLSILPNFAGATLSQCRKFR